MRCEYTKKKTRRTVAVPAYGIGMTALPKRECSTEYLIRNAEELWLVLSETSAETEREGTSTKRFNTSCRLEMSQPT
jgi:hypothetical protein